MRGTGFCGGAPQGACSPRRNVRATGAGRGYALPRRGQRDIPPPPLARYPPCCCALGVRAPGHIPLCTLHAGVPDGWAAPSNYPAPRIPVYTYHPPISGSREGRRTARKGTPPPAVWRSKCGQHFEPPQAEGKGWGFQRGPGKPQVCPYPFGACGAQPQNPVPRPRRVWQNKLHLLVSCLSAS